MKGGEHPLDHDLAQQILRGERLPRRQFDLTAIDEPAPGRLTLIFCEPSTTCPAAVENASSPSRSAAASSPATPVTSTAPPATAASDELGPVEMCLEVQKSA